MALEWPHWARCTFVSTPPPQVPPSPRHSTSFRDESMTDSLAVLSRSVQRSNSPLVSPHFFCTATHHPLTNSRTPGVVSWAGVFTFPPPFALVLHPKLELGFLRLPFPSTFGPCEAHETRIHDITMPAPSSVTAPRFPPLSGWDLGLSRDFIIVPASMAPFSSN